MDKSCQTTGESTAASTDSLNHLTHPSLPSAATTGSGSGNTNSTNNGRDQYLRHLNKLSHKISKPTTATGAAAVHSNKALSFDPLSHLPQHHHQPPLSQPQSLAQQQQQNQPPVYNINKNDFRDVVQKLTGSPAHERISNPTAQPPPIQASKPASSRLQRIRPPPLAQISNRPSPLMNCHMPPQNSFNSAPIGNPGSGFGSGNAFMGTLRPLSPLPPLPTCHATAESPISAYMRFLHNSVSGGMGVDSDPKRFPGVPPPLPPLASPKYINHTAANPPAHVPSQQPPAPGSSSSLQFVMPPQPSSPLPFGCFPSPKSPCPLLSPNMPFSPTGTGGFGFPAFPLSPGVPPVPSPK